MERDKKCQHNERMDDRCGVTCLECGQVVEGYGYGGPFGSNLTGKEQCLHANWYAVRGGEPACPYCHEVLKDIT
jgi:hypothetical protein